MDVTLPRNRSIMNPYHRKIVFYIGQHNGRGEIRPITVEQCEIDQSEWCNDVELAELSVFATGNDMNYQEIKQEMMKNMRKYQEI